MSEAQTTAAHSAASELDQIRAWRDAIVAATHLASSGDIAVALQRVVDTMGAHITAAQDTEAPPASGGVIAAAESLIQADRDQTLTDDHVHALENAIAIQRGTIKLPDAAPQPSGAPALTVPTERGLYAWVAAGASASLVNVHTRPTRSSDGGVLNGEIMNSSTFWDGCAVADWTGGTWFGPLRVGGVVVGAAKAQGDRQ